MIEPLQRIEPAEEIGHAFNGVRLARIAVANCAKAKEGLLGFGIAFPVGTAIWWAILLAAAAWVPESYALIGAFGLRFAVWLSLFGAAVIAGGLVFPSIAADTPALPKRNGGTEEKDGVLTNVLLTAIIIAFFPVIAAFAINNLLSTVRHDPKVKVTGVPGEDDTARASAVLADDRVRKLYGDLVEQIDDWNAAILPVNRLIHLANAGEAELSEDETALVAEYHAQQASLDRLVALAAALLSEGRLGTRPGNDAADAEDPLLRIHDRVPRIRERMVTLSEGSKRLVAAREVHAAGNRT